MRHTKWKTTEGPTTSRRINRDLSPTIRLSVWEGITEGRSHSIASMDLRPRMSTNLPAEEVQKILDRCVPHMEAIIQIFGELPPLKSTDEEPQS